MVKISKYEANKGASVGSELTCPVCGSAFVKRSYQQAFCCGLCKDKYHNERRKGNGYFRRYNAEHPERLERIGIVLDADAELCLGDCECESMARIAMCEDAAQYEY